MILQRLIYLFEIFALQSIWGFHSLSNVLSEEAEKWQIADVLKQHSWTDVLQVRDVQRQVTRSKAPRFMMDLYEKNLQNPAHLQGLVVRSFSGSSDGAFHFFNLTSFDQSEKIIKAEYRWFWSMPPFLQGHHLYKVDLYEVLESRGKPWQGSLITSRLLPLYTRGREVFDITQTVTKWIHNNSTYNGILVISTPPLRHWLETIQMKGATGFKQNHAFIVIYSDDGQRGSGPNTELPFDLLNYKSSPQTLVRWRRSTKDIMFRNEQSVTCQRMPLYVDFAKLGWSGWIISPSGYNAYHCTGSCPFPLVGNFQTTNHAIVQSIVNTLKITDQVGKPCCVPNDLFPISLLYFDDDENVVLKQYDHMVAGSCGCH